MHNIHKIGNTELCNVSVVCLASIGLKNQQFLLLLCLCLLLFNSAFQDSCQNKVILPQLTIQKALYSNSNTDH